MLYSSAVVSLLIIASASRLIASDSGFPPPGANRGAMLCSWKVTEDDIKTLSEWGANLARYQMSVGWGKENANRDESEFNAWIDRKLNELDNVLAWGQKYGVRIVVDMHVPPGGRAKGGEMNMFHEKKYAVIFAKTWRKIAIRYKGDRRIYGYDLINEPTNLKPSPENLDWWTVQFKVAEVINKIDPDARIIVESNEWAQAKTFKDMKKVPLPNIIYQLHVYTPVSYTHQGTGRKAVTPEVLTWPDEEKGWNREWLREKLRPVREFQLANDARIYVGEFSASVRAAGAENYIADCIALFNEYGWDWTYHAFRESKNWSVEHATGEDGSLIKVDETPRRKALIEGFRQ